MNPSADARERAYDEDAIKAMLEDFVTWGWREVVCMCPAPTDKKMPNGRTSCMFCGLCGLYRRWLYRTCNRCKNQYIHHFVHHEAREHYWCYDCLVAVSGELDTDKNYCTAQPKQPRTVDEILGDGLSIDLGF